MNIYSQVLFMEKSCTNVIILKILISKKNQV